MKLSVVIPAYNAENYIQNCLSSVFNQTYKDLEVVVVDDGSTDNTLAKVTEFGCKFSNIVIIHQENSGVVNARSTGLKASSGEYVTFMDADDWIEEDAYASILPKMGKEMIAVYTKYVIRQSSMSIYDDPQKRICLMQFPTSMWAYIYPRKIIESVIIFPEIHFFEDFVINYQVLGKCNNIMYVDKNYYHYENNPNSINRQGLTFKRLSCLKIIPLIREGGELFSERVQNEIPFAVAHFLISNLTVALKTDSKEKLIQLKKTCRDNFPYIFHAKYVPLYYKFYVLFGSLSINLICFINRLRRLHK